MPEATYDLIAEEYKTSKTLSFRKYIESYSLLQLCGALKEKTVLDLACGEGIYARQFKTSGAQHVLGIDISQEMIKLAQDEEAQRPLGCHYAVSDVKSLQVNYEFDLVTGVYLLNYAQTQDELIRFCQSAIRHLKPGGRFLGINDNPFNTPERYPAYKKYGFIKESPENRQEGDYVCYTMFNPDGSTCSFNNYYLSPETYEEVFAAVGFKKFRWHWPCLAPDQLTNPYWHYFMDYPPIIAFSAEK